MQAKTSMHPNTRVKAHPTTNIQKRTAHTVLMINDYEIAFCILWKFSVWKDHGIVLFFKVSGIKIIFGCLHLKQVLVCKLRFFQCFFCVKCQVFCGLFLDNFTSCLAMCAQNIKFTKHAYKGGGSMNFLSWKIGIQRCVLWLIRGWYLNFQLQNISQFKVNSQNSVFPAPSCPCGSLYSLLFTVAWNSFTEWNFLLLLAVNFF